MGNLNITKKREPYSCMSPLIIEDLKDFFLEIIIW